MQIPLALYFQVRMMALGVRYLCLQRIYMPTELTYKLVKIKRLMMLNLLLVDMKRNTNFL
jgi:hypothetical protein